MTYKIIVTAEAETDIEAISKSGNKNAKPRLSRILMELREHPKTGIGKPEPLKHEYSGYWSCQITDKH